MTATLASQILVLTASLSFVISDMRLGSDGRYTRVTVRLSDDIPESQCAKILGNLKVCICICDCRICFGPIIFRYY